MWLCINLHNSIFLRSRAMIKQLLIILSQTCCIMLINFNLYCRWGRKHHSLWQPCCIFTFYLYRYTYLCHILQFQAQRYRPTKKRGQSQLKLPSICFWENFPTTKNVSKSVHNCLNITISYPGLIPDVQGSSWVYKHYNVMGFYCTPLKRGGGGTSSLLP